MSTNLIWKRPDGFHGATPHDFSIVQVASHSNLWIHKTEKDTFPFRVAGGWEEEDQSKRLNNLVNLLNEHDDVWADHLLNLYHHTMKDDPNKFCPDLTTWLEGLKQVIKGGNWEIEIVEQALDAVKAKISSAEAQFLARAK